MSCDNQWAESHKNSVNSQINYEPTYAFDGTTGIGVDKAFIIFSFRDVTTANIILKLSPREVTRYWQHEKFSAIYRQISEQFSTIRLRQDNWDECDSEKPNKLSLSYAEGIIIDLLSSVIDAGYLWLTPFISSDEDGNITMEWHKGQHELHIEVSEDEVEYIKVWGANIEHEMHLDFLKKNNYLTLWDWLLHG
ncbi:MAG: hypothetical protein KAT04_08770 [Methylococcales bacterium]|nr:hypothetical protein [Methylococcales bacterium]